MPKFSNTSFSKLSTCHIDLQTIFYEVIKIFDCTIITGFRNEETQEKSFNTKKSKLDWPKSKHNKLPSLAVTISLS